jgi:membrane protein YfhO
MSGPARRAARRVLVHATLALLVLAAFEAALRPSRVLFERDIHAYFYPQREALRAAVAQGRSVPLWNPWVGFGAPFLADASAELAYPPTWLLLPLPAPLQFELFAVAHGIVAALGAAALARRLVGGELAALAAGASYALAGPVLSAVGLYHHYAGAALLPWVLWALEGALERPSRRRSLALAALAAAQLAAGSLDLVMMTGLLAFARLALAAARGEAAKLKPALAPLALAAGLALGLGAVQWLPTAERGLNGLRAQQDERTRSYWSLHPRSLVDLAVPRLVSDAPHSAAERAELYEGREPLLACLYVGVITLTLGGLALALAPAPALPFAGGAAALLLLSLGRHTPVYALMLALPGFALLRYPQKYLLPASLCLALLAAQGAAAVAREWSAADVRRARVLAATLAALAILLAASGTLASGGAGGGVALVKCLRSSLLLVLSGACLWARSAGSAPRPRPAVTLLLAGAIDLVLVGHGTNPTAPASLYDRPAVVELVGRSPGRVYAAAGPGCLEPAPGEDDSRGVTAARGFLETLRPPSVIRWGLRGSYDGEFTGIGPRWSAPFSATVAARFDTPEALRLLKLGGVDRVLLVGRDVPAAFERLATLPSSYVCPLHVLAVPDPLPPAFVAARERPGRDDGPGGVLEPGFDPRSEVLIAGGEASSEPGRSAPAEVVARRPDVLEVRTELRAPGVLVVTEAFDDGWQAEVDGRPATVLRANGLFRAVRLGAGLHHVVFRYRPPAVVAGVLASAVSLVAMLALLLRAPRN